MTALFRVVLACVIGLPLNGIRAAEAQVEPGRDPAAAQVREGQGSGRVNTEAEWLEAAGFADLALESRLAALAATTEFSRRRALTRAIAGSCIARMLTADLNGAAVEWPAGFFDQVEESLEGAERPGWQLVRLFARQQAIEASYARWWRGELDAAATLALKREWQAQLTALALIVEPLEVAVTSDQITGRGKPAATPSRADNGSRQSSVEPLPETLLARALCLAARINARIAEVGPRETTATERRESIRLGCRLLGLGDAPELAGEQLAALQPGHSWQLVVLEDLGVCRAVEENMLPPGVIDAIGRGFGSEQAAIAQVRICARSGRFEAMLPLLEAWSSVTPAGESFARVWREAAAVWIHVPAESRAARSRIFWTTALNLARRQRDSLRELKPAVDATGWPPADDAVLADWIAGELALANVQQESTRVEARRESRLPGWLSSHPQLVEGIQPEQANAQLAEAVTRLQAACSASSQLLTAADQALAWQSLATACRMSGQYGDALAAADRAEALWHGAADPRAAQAGTMVLELASELARRGALERSGLEARAAELAARYAGTATGSTARLVLLREISGTLPASERLALWREFHRGQPGNPAVKLELLQALVQSIANPDPDSADLRGQTGEVAESLVNLELATAGQQVRAVSLLIEAGGVSPENVARWLARAERLAAEPQLEEVERGEAWFAVMRLAELAGAAESSRRAVDWLVQHPQPWPWHRTALQIRFRQLERLVSGSAFLSDAVQRELAVVCRRLLDVTGDGREVFASSAEASRVGQRLAGLLDGSGRRDEALRLYGELVAARPGELVLVEQAAGLASRMGLHEVACDWWRRLGQLNDAGSEEWRAARYNLAACLMATDREAARLVAQQTAELDPDMPAAWRDRYRELGSR